MKVSQILEYFNQIAPFETAEDFDNIGLIVGKKDGAVNKIMFCLDCSDFVIDEAIEKGCDLIISHHPMIFSPVKKINDDDFITKKAIKLIENGISLISMHTNLDAMENGVCHNLCTVLGLDNIIYNGGCFKICQSVPISPKELAQKVKKALNLPFIKFVGESSNCEKIGVCCGSGMSFSEEMISLGVDTIITGDIKYHAFIENLERKINLIDCGHFESEIIYIEKLKKIIDNKFGIDSLISTKEKYFDYI